MSDTMPDIDQSARDETVQAKAGLGAIGRLRLVLSVPLFKMAVLMVPREVRETYGDLEVRKPDEEF